MLDCVRVVYCSQSVHIVENSVWYTSGKKYNYVGEGVVYKLYVRLGLK